MVKKTKNLLLIFAKYPEPGLVKTRLGRSIGYERAALIYKAFLTDLANRFLGQTGSFQYDTRWVFVPTSSCFPKLIEEILHGREIKGHLSFAAYETSGLLQQQIEQFTWARRNGYQKVVGISTDTPHLPDEYVSDAFRALSDYDIVLGRTPDGGFYLLATNPINIIQREIEMSTNHVARDILKTAKILGLRTYLLPTMLDVDEEYDLKLLIQMLLSSPVNNCPATRQLLVEH